MNKSIFFLITPTLIMTPLITMSLNSWLSMWISMEINFMSYIPLMIYLNKYNKNISNKYFIIQSISSTIFLSGPYFDLMMNSIHMNLISSTKILLLNFGILIKLGLPPFQNWFIDLMKNMNWINCIILSNWQKIIPMIILSHIYSLVMIYTTSILCLLMTPLGMNFSSTQMIMSFSSINQMGWILMIMPNKEMSWKWYFIMYMISNSSIMFFFLKFKINSINQTNNLNNFLTIWLLIILIISISGMPPFLGFLIKILMIKNFSNTPLILLFMMLSMFTFIMYTRICYKLIFKTIVINKIIMLIKFNFMNFPNTFIFFLPLIFWLISFNWTN